MGKECRTAVALTRYHLALLLDIVDQLLYEETLFVDVQVLRAFIQSAFPTDEEAVAPARVIQAFPNLYGPDGQRIDQVRPKKAERVKTQAKPKKSKKNRENEDVVPIDWEAEVDKSALSWAAQRRQLRRKSRMERRRSEEEIKTDVDDYETEVRYTDEDCLSLPKDALQLLLDDLSAEAEILFENACDLGKHLSNGHLVETR